MPARLVQVTLQNDSRYPLRWIQDHLDHGEWQQPWYPSNLVQLNPGEQGAFRSESDGLFTGTEGWALFGAEVPEDDPTSPAFSRTEFVRIYWSRPYVGNFGFDLAVTRSDPRNGSGRGGSVFTDPRPPHTEIAPVDLGTMGSSESLLGQILSSGIITPVGALWSGTGPGLHVRLGVALRNRATIASPLVTPRPARKVRAISAHSGKVLDVKDVSADNGAPILQWDWWGGDNQKWQLEDVGDGLWRVVSVHSGKVLDVKDVSADNGALIQQWDWWGGDNQKWRLEPLLEVVVPGGGHPIVAIPH